MHLLNMFGHLPRSYRHKKNTGGKIIENRKQRGSLRINVIEGYSDMCVSILPSHLFLLNSTFTSSSFRDKNSLYFCPSLSDIFFFLAIHSVATMLTSHLKYFIQHLQKYPWNTDLNWTYVGPEGTSWPFQTPKPFEVHSFYRSCSGRLKVSNRNDLSFECLKTRNIFL